MEEENFPYEEFLIVKILMSDACFANKGMYVESFLDASFEKAASHRRGFVVVVVVVVGVRHYSSD